MHQGIVRFTETMNVSDYESLRLKPTIQAVSSVAPGGYKTTEVKHDSEGHFYQ